MFAGPQTALFAPLPTLAQPARVQHLRQSQQWIQSLPQQQATHQWLRQLLVTKLLVTEQDAAYVWCPQEANRAIALA